MHEKSVVDGSSGRGLRGSDRPFVRLWNRVGKQRRFGAYTSPLWSPLVVRPLDLSCLILRWLLSLWSSLDLACLVFVFGGLFLSCPVFSSLGPSALWGVLESLLGTSGGTSWGLWEPSGGLLRPILALLTALDPPGPFLGRSWASPGPSWGALGAYLGRSWQLLAALGPRLGRPGALLGGP